MPVNVVKTKKDEAKWKKATDIAAKAGKEDNYAYIMGIYKKMKPDYKFNKTASVLLSASKRGKGSKNFYKTAAIGQKSTATQDFIGGFDPTGSFTGAYGLANQARGKTEEEHRRSKRLAIAGGAVGSGIALPVATTGLVKGIQEAAAAKGGVGARLAAGARGFVQGAKTIPTQLAGAFRARQIGARAVREGGTKVTRGERQTLMNLARQQSVQDVLKGNKRRLGGGVGIRDGANLYLRNRVSANLGQQIKSKANTGLAAGLGGLGLGAAVGAGGAGIQYDKGRKSYEDSVAFARRQGRV